MTLLPTLLGWQQAIENKRHRNSDRRGPAEAEEAREHVCEDGRLLGPNHERWHESGQPCENALSERW